MTLSPEEIFAIVRDVRKLPPQQLKIVRATIDFCLACLAKETHDQKQGTIMQNSELKTRIAMLKRLAKKEGVPLPDDVAHYIAASAVPSNEIEGTLVRVVAYASLRNAEITLPFAREVLNVTH